MKKLIHHRLRSRPKASKVKSEKIPRKMEWLFWSYDISSLDLKKDKDYIVTQVLNYGTWDDVRWLFRKYSKKEIANIIKNPSPGLWFKNIIDFWLKMFDIKLRENVYRRSLVKN